MNKLISALHFILALLLISGLASAQIDSFKTKAGITPDSSLYSLDIFFEKNKLKNLPESEGAVYLIEKSKERLAEIILMIEKGDLEAANKAMDVRVVILADAKALTTVNPSALKPILLMSTQEDLKILSEWRETADEETKLKIDVIKQESLQYSMQVNAISVTAVKFSDIGITYK